MVNAYELSDRSHQNSARNENSLPGEGPDAEGPPIDLDGGRTVGRRRGDHPMSPRNHAGILEIFEQTGLELELRLRAEL